MSLKIEFVQLTTAAGANVSALCRAVPRDRLHFRLSQSRVTSIIKYLVNGSELDYCGVAFAGAAGLGGSLVIVALHH